MNKIVKLLVIGGLVALISSPVIAAETLQEKKKQ